MPCADDRLQRIADGVVKRKICREDCRLTKLRLAQLLFRALLHERRQIVTENRARPFKEIPGLWGVAGKVGAHADDLRALSGEDGADRHYTAHRQVTAPHERPPPKPTNTMTSPSLILPDSTASESAIGMDAADVLPYS